MYGKMDRHLPNNQQYMGNITENQLLTQDHSHRYWENCGNQIPYGQCADDANNRVTVDDIMWKSLKMIAQINCTK